VNAPAFSETLDISMRDFFFSPRDVTIQAGDTVRWTNEQGLHTTTGGTGCDADGIWDSGSMIPGENFSFTFSQTGTYPYFCGFHCFNGMTGTIHVNPSALIPVPSTPQAFPFFQAGAPLLSGDPSQAEPIGLGPVATGGNMLNIEIGLNQFAGPVDVYLAVFAPSLNPEILVLTPSGLQPLSAGLTPWLQSTTGPLAVALLQSFPLSALPQGSYTFFLAAAPPADTSVFYLWMTGFTFSSQLAEPIPEAIAKGDTTITLQSVATGLTAPNYGTFAPGDPNRLFVADQTGILWAIDLTTGSKTIFLSVTSRLIPLGISGSGTFDERGFLGFAFDPEYMSNGLLYTYTSEPVRGQADFPLFGGTTVNHQSVITGWRVPEPLNQSSVVDPASARVLLRVDQPQFNHNGGAMNFGSDGMLYIALGDGGSADDQGAGHSARGNGQDTSNVLGSILRIDPQGTNSANGQYGVPADNPFFPEGVLTAGGQSGCLDGFCDEIFAFGFRNPFRFSFDIPTGNLYAADVGQNDIEEINIVTRGGNYGWPIREGSFCFDHNGNGTGFVTGVPVCGPPDLINPIAQYDHDEGVAVLGGFVYRGSSIPALAGRYVFGDYFLGAPVNAGRLFFLGGNNTIFEFQIAGQETLGFSLLGFGQDAHGELYVLGNTTGIPFGVTGVVLKIAP
jgi:glucose/arabinose dehydrogenase/plastocyanin